MKISPVYTEKSMGNAKNGKYTFFVLPSFSKTEIKKAVEKTFGVVVDSVKTLNSKKISQRTFRGKNKVSKATKKILVTLKSGKISLFEEVK